MSRKRGHNSPVESPPSGNISEGSSKEQDRYLPIANVGRIMKKSLPANAKISKEAKETVQDCVSEFISFITGEASEKCQREKRKTINGDDLLWAMTTLGFENYVGPLKAYLNGYRESEGEKNSMARHDRDHSPTNTTTTTTSSDHGANYDHQIGRPSADSIVLSAGGPDFRSFNHQLGAVHEVTPKGFEDGGSVVGYGETLVPAADKAMASAHLHYGSEW